jgi:flagellar motor switch protein FliN
VPADLRSILTLEVPLIVVIASRDLPVKEVMNFVPGAIIELPKLADEELEILINNKPIGLGNAVKVGENFGIRITYVGNQKDRIRALAEPAASEPIAASAPNDNAAAALAEELLAGQAT